MKDLYDRGVRVDRVTVADELMKQGQLESVDGLSYLISLDEGLPEIANLESYIRIVKDKSTLRRLIFSAQKVIDRCLIGEEEPDEILSSAEETLLKLGEGRAQNWTFEPPSSSLCAWLGDYAEPARRLFASGKRIAQEHIGWEFLQGKTAMD